MWRPRAPPPAPRRRAQVSAPRPRGAFRAPSAPCRAQDDWRRGSKRWCGRCPEMNCPSGPSSRPCMTFASVLTCVGAARGAKLESCDSGSPRGCRSPRGAGGDERLTAACALATRWHARSSTAAPSPRRGRTSRGWRRRRRWHGPARAARRSQRAVRAAAHGARAGRDRRPVARRDRPWEPSRERAPRPPRGSPATAPPVTPPPAPRATLKRSRMSAQANSLASRQGPSAVRAPSRRLSKSRPAPPPPRARRARTHRPVPALRLRAGRRPRRPSPPRRASPR